MITKLEAGGKPLSEAEIAMMDMAFRREREMELVLLRERHRKLRKAREEMGQRSMTGMGGVAMEMDTWLANYLVAAFGPKWMEDKTLLRMLREELPEVFYRPEGTKIQSGYRGGKEQGARSAEKKGPKFRKVYA